MLFRAFVDICATLPFLGITPQIKESVQSKNKASLSSTGQQQYSSTNQDSVSKFYGQLSGFLLCVLDFLRWAGRLISINHTFYLKSYYILFYFGNVNF